MGSAESLNFSLPEDISQLSAWISLSYTALLLVTAQKLYMRLDLAETPQTWRAEHDNGCSSIPSSLVCERL